MLRLPFIAFGLASILLFQLVAQQLDGRRAGLLTALLLALSPFHAYYSTEIRMYAIVLFAAAANFLFFLRLLHRTGVWNWLGYTATAILGLSARDLLRTAPRSAGDGPDVIQCRPLLPGWLAAQVLVAVGAAPAVRYGLFSRAFPSDILAWIEAKPLVGLLETLYQLRHGHGGRTGPMVVAPGVSLHGAVRHPRHQGGARRPAGTHATGRHRDSAARAVVIASFRLDVYSEQTTRYLAFLQPFLILLAVRGWQSVGRARTRAALYWRRPFWCFLRRSSPCTRSGTRSAWATTIGPRLVLKLLPARGSEPPLSLISRPDCPSLTNCEAGWPGHDGHR